MTSLHPHYALERACEYDGVVMRKPARPWVPQHCATVTPAAPQSRRGSQESVRCARQLLRLVDVFPHQRAAIVLRAKQLVGRGDLRAELSMAADGPTDFRKIEASEAFKTKAGAIVAECIRYEIANGTPRYYEVVMRAISEDGPSFTREQMRLLVAEEPIAWNAVKFV